jgi:predicted ATPase/DNA-binding SARP family transcriptional activator
MHIALLGELEVLDSDGNVVTVPGAKLRALLAVLALHVGRAVSPEQLADALWGEAPPPGVRNSLQGLVSRLRRALGSNDVVAMRGGGYVLDLERNSIDIHRFEDLVGEARAAAGDGDDPRARELLVTAASLWRGHALAEFVYEDFAASVSSRLSELRLTAIEDRLELDLRLGNHTAVVSELESLVSAHPLRERLRGLLMLALYRSGRQADALRAFQDGREVLAEQLGLDPSPELRSLEGAILAHDPALAAPAPRASAQAADRAIVRYAIPAPLTPLIGRDVEVRGVADLVTAHRLVTLVGPGGVGKTALALDVARRAGVAASSGACLVELAPVGDPAGIPAAIAAALDLPDPTRLAEAIGERELLVVFDNCEHVIEGAAVIAEDLLRRCPSLRLLATSREGLRVGGEVVWAVPPLNTEDAVELFNVRATAVGSTHDRPDEVGALVAEICARLDGLPLAIELAAARTRAFPIRQIASRLNDRFRLLTGGSRTALPRQQTLRAVVDWSYELLFDDEQRVFERLSVFPGGCDLPTAEAICSDDDIAPHDVGDIIHALVDKSLVSAVRTGDDVRFAQLQTLAQYGREKLAERGDAERVRDDMARHYSTLCARSATAYVGREQEAWLVAIDREHDNLRGALEWAVASGDAETALTIAGGVAWPHWLAGTAVEGKRWIDDAFGCAGEASASTRALALTGRGLLDFQTGHQQNVDADFESALATFSAAGDDASVALAQSFYTEVAATRGDHDEAVRRRQASIDMYDGRTDEFGFAARPYSQAKLALLTRDLVAAERYYRQALERFTGIDRPLMLSMCLAVVADFDERAGNFAAAIEKLEAAAGINEALGLRGFNASTLAWLAWARLQLGDIDRAYDAASRAVDLARRLTHTAGLIHALTGLAAVQHLRGQNADAVALAAEALHLYEGRGHRRLANRVDAGQDSLVALGVNYTVLAFAAEAEGDSGRAAEMLAEADHLLAAADAGVPVFQRDDVAALREQLSVLVR